MVRPRGGGWAEHTAPQGNSDVNLFSYPADVRQGLNADVEQLASIVEPGINMRNIQPKQFRGCPCEGRSARQRKRKLRLKTNFHHRINTIAATTSLTTKIPLAPSGKSSSH